MALVPRRDLYLSIIRRLLLRYQSIGRDVTLVSRFSLHGEIQLLILGR